MGEPLDNPRALREANRRFDYDRRNKGMDQAMIERQARNAVRRQQDRRTAEIKTADLMSNAADRALRKDLRKFNSNSFSD